MDTNDQHAKNTKRVSLPTLLLLIGGCSAFAAIVISALLVNIFERKDEARNPDDRLASIDEDTVDPAVWGINWPRQYDSYKRTVDYERTKYGGSDAIPKQKLDQDPWLRMMWSGYAFSIDYREARGHAYMLIDQEQTERVQQRPQPGACLHCHSSVLPLYRYVGDGDVMDGFMKVNPMTWHEARFMKDEQGNELVTHPASCVDCHSPETMNLRVTRPAFLNGIRELKKHQGIENFDVNKDASRQEMRTYVCAQCHVEYHFKGEQKTVTYPWSKGLQVQEIEAYYDESGFFDWKHGITGAEVLKAQHPEFELWSQGIHARSGVSCSDCHMPYHREGAVKVSDHHVRSPLLNIARSCQTCHSVSEAELLSRAEHIQDKTKKLINRAAAALVDLLNATVAAKERGASEEQLAPVLKMQRKAQWRLDYVYSENSVGFHAPQETARILAEAIDFARQGESLAQGIHLTPVSLPDDLGEPVYGVTPDAQAPTSDKSASDKSN